MQELNSLDADSILSDDILCEVFSEEDEIYKARMLLSLTDRADVLGVKTKFTKLVTAYKKAKAKYDKENAPAVIHDSMERMTDFGHTKINEMQCGSWIANGNGVKTFSPFSGEIIACYHPIFPTQRLINVETGKEKIKLDYKKGNRWNNIIVDKGVIASANKIVSLADYGVSVTSETARNLVRYLSDIENYNIDTIPVQVSTSKLGWVNGEYMPYGCSTIFDSETKYKSTYEAIHEEGSEETWLSLIGEVRKTGRIEPAFYMAGSFASALVEPLNALPFIVNLWGDTGKGKTVAIMLAASVWAKPDADYITDPKSTVTALELRLDFLNNFPFLVDDMAQLKNKYGGDFSELVYMLCSGHGKDRANASLGLNKPTSWKNVILTNGEHSLVTETMQGGAINRIIDIEMGDGYIFPNGNEVVESLKQHYGHAGRRFIDAINQMGFDTVREIQQDFLRQINELAKEQGVEKEEKQTLPMSILMAADMIATDHIFRDGIYLDLKTCVDILKNKGEVSENERAYEFILSAVSVNTNKFFKERHDVVGEVWGVIEDEYVMIISNIFNDMCKDGNFSSKSFLSWAKKNGLIQCDSEGRTAKLKKINGSKTGSRCVFLKLPSEGQEFMTVSDGEEDTLPFNKK
ncbi:DUF927 domain-containing protein [Parasporobacterium paucivorans]|uniref:DUF927 domain-containing protein n=1 Tax=Parasporobacterium paucivorans DSM 15970 TaxID=1122934 RepID=A0A1M6B5Q6_9FIRM|nr:DUF927 domain-containing protein [Parasporobacterium paucivorans]SHI44072.1 protein of unknown function [Parasporobacterium paucivorans DSM 15970]